MSEPPVSDGPAEARLGFYGKLPARGDFVTRRLPRGFTDPWDSWLQQGLAQAMQQLGPDWLARYLVAPLWRFLLAPGVCGEAAMMGVVMPSSDRVGRYFPLTLAVPLAGGAMPARTMLAAADWFARVEEIALSALDDGVDLEVFDGAAGTVASPAGAAGPIGAADAVAIALTSGGGDGLAAGAIDAIDGLLAGFASPYALWWTSGSQDEGGFRPVFALTAGLPPAHRFTAFLDGQWEHWGWRTR